MGERHGLIDRTGKVILPCKYHTSWNGIYPEAKRIVFEEGSKKGILDFKDTVIIPAIYDDIYGVNDPLLIVKIFDTDGKREGVLDHTGKTILPLGYDEIKWLKDKTHLVCRKNGVCEVYRYMSKR